MTRTANTTALSLDDFLSQHQAPAFTGATLQFMGAGAEQKLSDEQARAGQVERLAKYDGERIRVHISGRKMSVPGRLQGYTLLTNWGLELDLSQETITKVEIRNSDTGRFVAA